MIYEPVHVLVVSLDFKINPFVGLIALSVVTYFQFKIIWVTCFRSSMFTIRCSRLVPEKPNTMARTHTVQTKHRTHHCGPKETSKEFITSAL